MIDAFLIKQKRAAAGIAGIVLSRKLGMARSRLSDIERGYAIASSEELARIHAALAELIEAKSFIDRVAASVGWPSGVRRDR